MLQRADLRLRWKEKATSNKSGLKGGRCESKATTPCRISNSTCVQRVGKHYDGGGGGEITRRRKRKLEAGQKKKAEDETSDWQQRLHRGRRTGTIYTTVRVCNSRSPLMSLQHLSITTAGCRRRRAAVLRAAQRASFGRGTQIH